MKTIMTIVSLLIFTTLYSQQNTGELPEGKYSKFLLKQVALAQVDGIYYYDLEGTGTKYYVNLAFGRNTFDLQLVETSTNKIVWGTYGLGMDLKVSKRTQSMIEFKMEKKLIYVTSTYDVQLTTTGTMTASYTEVDNKTSKVVRSVVAIGEVKAGKS